MNRLADALRAAAPRSMAVSLLFASLAMACDPSQVEPVVSEEDPGASETRLALVRQTLDWYPGHYLLLGNGRSEVRDRALSTPGVVGHFRGLHIKYLWSEFEGQRGDYSAGFARLDADLAAVQAVGMTLLVQLQSKTFGGGSEPAVPAYLRRPGTSFCAPDQPAVCGEYRMGNGRAAMIWNDAVRLRFEALVTAVGKRYSPGGERAAIGRALAGVALPETATEEGSISRQSTGYSQPKMVEALTQILRTSAGAFPSKVVFQYINFLPPNAQARPYLKEIADFALRTPGIGLGCPDLAPALDTPAYGILKDPKYAALPMNPAVQAPDLDLDRTTGVEATMDLGLRPAPAGMGAEYVTWFFGRGSAITVEDVMAEIDRRGKITAPPPSW